MRSLKFLSLEDLSPNNLFRKALAVCVLLLLVGFPCSEAWGVEEENSGQEETLFSVLTSWLEWIRFLEPDLASGEEEREPEISEPPREEESDETPDWGPAVDPLG